MPDDLLRRLEPVVLEQFSKGDFHRVDMRSIGKAAGMSFATIYRHFGDKEAMLFWFVERWIAHLNPLAVAALEGQGSTEEKLRECLAVHLRFYEANPEVGRILFLTVPVKRWMSDRTFENAALTGALTRALSAGQGKGELRCDVPMVALLDAFSAIFNRAFLMWEYRKRKYRLAEQLDPMFAILWGGIASERKAPRSRRGSRARVVAE